MTEPNTEMTPYLMDQYLEELQGLCKMHESLAGEQVSPLDRDYHLRKASALAFAIKVLGGNSLKEPPKVM